MYKIEQINKNLIARGSSSTIRDGDDGCNGAIKHGKDYFRFQFSFGEGWEHLSVSVYNQKRCPTWEEMCFFKDIFWSDREACVQFHPPKDQYVNNHGYCLHIWKPIDQTIPLPKSILVGVR